MESKFRSFIWVYQLERINPETGRRELIDYTGDLRDKPKGYKLIWRKRVEVQQSGLSY